MKRILVIQLQQIGDVLLSTAICGTLKKTFPEAEIDYLVADFAEGIIQGHPAISEVLSFDKKGGLLYFLKFLSRIRKKKYDIVIDILCKPRSGIMALYSGAKRRISFSRKGRSIFYSDLLPETLGLKIHTIDHRLTLLDPLKIPIKVDKTVKIYLEESLIQKTQAEFIKKGLDSNSLKIVFGINSRRSFKVWPQEYFLKVINHCIEKYNAKIVFFYNEKEKEFCLEAKAKVCKPENVYADFSGSIREIAAVFKCCDLFVGNDSGPRHIAEAVDTATFAIYSPSSSKYNWNTQGNPKFQSIDLQDALQLSDQEFKEMLKEANKENAENYLRKISPEFVMQKLDQMIFDLKLSKGKI